ncbi:hypothetical protein ACFE04_028466 [Oxalis oulophora]
MDSLHQLEQQKENNNYTNPTLTSTLLAKKRRESWDPLPPFLLPQTPTPTTTTTYDGIEKCGLAFHVTCGLNEDFCIEYREQKKKSGGSGVVAGFCRDPTELWKKICNLSGLFDLFILILIMFLDLNLGFVLQQTLVSTRA